MVDQAAGGVAISMVGLLVLAGGVLGGLALLGLILANEKTRVAGVALIGFGVAMVVALGFVGFQSRQAAIAEQRVAGELAHARAAEAAARARVEAEQALEKLTEPKIKIEEDDVDAPEAAEQEALEAAAPEYLAMKAKVEEISRALKQKTAAYTKLLKEQKTPESKEASADERAEVDKDLARRLAEIESLKKLQRSLSDRFIVDELARPKWLDLPPTPSGSEVFSTVIDSGPYATVAESKRAADIALLNHVNAYLQTEHGLQDVATQPGDFGLTPKQLRDITVRDEFVEPFETSIGAELQRAFLLVEIAEEDGETLAGRLTKTLADRRRSDGVKRVGVLSGGVLGLLSLVFGLLKVDEATKGYYTKRLFLGVPAAILALLAVGLLLARG
ncbi:MAG: hypothetical protein AAGJ46_11530 [Planctomycetota bacterium]